MTDDKNDQPPPASAVLKAAQANDERLTDEQLGLEFPCVFPVKVMGRDQDNFVELVLEVIGGHVSTETATIKQRPSSNGKYLSVTVAIETESRSQLDRIYLDLNASDRVLMTL